MNQADTAWMLVATALVLLMTPALAFFYGGLVRSKNALNTMMMSFVALGFVGILWAMLGYSLAFGAGNNWIGDLSRMFLNGVTPDPQGRFWLSPEQTRAMLRRVTEGSKTPDPLLVQSLSEAISSESGGSQSGHK